MKGIMFPLQCALLFCVAVSCQDVQKTQQKQVKSKRQTPLLISNPSQEASCAYLTQDKAGNPVISWVEIDSTTQNKQFYFAELDTLTNKFSTPVAVPIPQNTSIHEEGMPKIAFKGDGTVFALFETSEPLKGSKWGVGDVRFIQSFDRGESWTMPHSIAPKDYRNQLSSSFSSLTRLSNGEIGVAWLSTSATPGQMGRPVKYAETIGADSLGHRAIIDTQACECCRTAISADASGNVVVAYRDLLDGQVRDISVSISRNNGTSFSAPVLFSEDNWVVNGCPHNGPSVVSSGESIFITWFTGRKDKIGVSYAELGESGKLKKRRHLDVKGHFIQLALMPNSVPVMAYNHSYSVNGAFYNKIVVAKITDHNLYKTTVTPEKSSANYPVLQPIDQNEFVVAWSADGKIYYRIVSLEMVKNHVINRQVPV